MRVALDTNRYVDFTRGLPEAVECIQRSERIYLPYVVLAELRAGFLGGTESAKNESVLTRFRDSPRVETLYSDEQTTHQYARVFIQLRRQGTPIPTNDVWIAALVLQHNLRLFARDRHFDHIPQLPRV